jgi:putative FmdB family regulatory protein
MPIYEYVCANCHRPFERLVRRLGEDVTCPSCASASVDRQLSVFAALSSSAAPSFEGCGAEACGAGPGACGGGACGMRS